MIFFFFNFLFPLGNTTRKLQTFTRFFGKKVKYNNVCKNFNNIFEKPYKKEEKHKETDIFKEIRR